MAPGSRPPLTTRIRNSFESKRSRSEATSPIQTNGFVTQDPQAFRAAIDDAINSEAFQKAIAANLARIIKPSIKDALDTLQPVVEAVYSHEMLLRRTNRSVEDLLTRIDTGQQSIHTNPQRPGTPGSPGTPGTPTTPRQRKSPVSANGQDIEQFRASLEKNNKRTVATLAELSSAVEANNKKVAEVVTGIEDIQATLVPTKDGFDSLKSFSENSNTNTAVMQAQLDQLKADIGLIIDAVGSDLGQNVKGIHEQVGSHPALLESHTMKLDAISTGLVALKGHADIVEKIQSVSADLEALKSYIEGDVAKRDEQLTGLGSQVGSVLTAVEGHAGTLAEIKDSNSSPAILEAVQRSNEHHESHATTLGEIKERSLAPGTGSEEASTPSSGTPESVAALEALKVDIAAMKENIASGLASHNENLTGLGFKVDTVLTTVEGHKAADQSADILAAVQKSHEYHTSHSEALEGIKSLDGSSTAPAPFYDTNFTALEAQLAALQTTLESHTGALDEIKSIKPSSSTDLVTTAEGSSSSGMGAEIGALTITLNTHTSILNEIKDNISAEILTALHDVGQAQASHSTILAEIREADVSDEILTTLHDAHTAHTASLDEIKTTRAIEPAASGEAPDFGALETQIGTLISTLEEHKATLAEIKDATTASNESHASHATVLGEIKSREIEPTPGAGGNVEALETQIGALSTALEEHKTTLSAIHEATIASNASLTAHATSLEEIKSRSVDAAPVFEGGDGGAQIGSIIATLEEQNATLAAIKDTTAASHDLHASHTSALGEIKEATAGLNEFHNSHTTALGEIKDAHATHATTLGEIRDTSTTSNESHAATLTEIKEATSGLNDFHTSHAATLGEIKDAHAAHATTLGEIKDATSASSESHAAHTATLAELKSTQPSETVSRSAPDSPDFPALDAHLTNIILTLEAQNGTLAEIKDATTHISELKSAIEESKAGVDAHGELVKDLHTETKGSHSELSQAIGALALGGAAGAGAGAVISHSEDSSSSEILEEVKAVRAIVEKSSISIEGTEEKVTSIVSQIEINHTTITTSLTALSDELKVEIDATGTQLTESITVLSGDVKAIDISSLNGSIDTCTQEVKNIATSIEALEGHTSNHTTLLSEGVHFNDKGLGQLKDNPTPASERGEFMPEASWFKKAGGSPTLSRQVMESPPAEKEYNYLSPVAEEQTPTLEKAVDFEEAPKEDDVEEPAAPVEEESPPVEEESEPIPEAVEPESEAVTELPAPVEEETIPVDQESESVSEVVEPESETVSEEATPIDPEVEPISEAVEPESESVPEAEPESVESESDPIPEVQAEAVEPESDPIPQSEPEAAEPETELESQQPEIDSIPEPSVEEPENTTEESPAAEVIPEHEEEAPIPEVKDSEPDEVIPEPEAIEPEAEIPIPEIKEADEPEEAIPVPETNETEQEEVPMPEPENPIEHDIPAVPVESESEPPVVEEHTAPRDDPEPLPEHSPEHDTPIPSEPQDDSPTDPPVSSEPQDNDPDLEGPSTPALETEPESASTSAIASPMSPSFPLSPTSKKGKKGKKEKKEKKGKGKKEKVPFSMDGEEPEDE